MCLFIPRFVVVQLYFSCCGQSSQISSLRFLWCCFAVYLVLPEFAGVAWICRFSGVAWICSGVAVFLVLLSHSPGGGAVRRLPVQGVWLELVVVQLVLL